MQPVHVDDLQSAGDEFPRGREIALRDGHRTVLAVPLIREGRALGTIIIRRTEVRPFEQKHIALLKTFADQAVIAIENTRLLNELSERTDDLTESLEQQTATSDVLQVISSSQGEDGPVFQAVLENATHLCEANFGILNLYENGGHRTGAMHNAPPAFREARKHVPLHRPHPSTPLAKVVATKQTIHVFDYAEEPAYKQRDPGAVRLVELAGVRTFLLVPMLKDTELIGTISIYRQEVRPFTDKQIALVQNFAAQAVIAIENTRLLNELRQRTDDLSESLEQQTATSEVLSVISSSPGELEPVFQAMLENATRICEANFGVLNRFENGELHVGAMHNVPSAFAEFLQAEGGAFKPVPGSVFDRVVQTKRVSYTADNAAEAVPGRAATLGGARSTVCVPMLKDDVLIGTITIYRQEVRPFTDKQIALVQNFAAQAVIAIENTRLLNELRQRTDDLTESLEQQTATSEVLKVISSSPGELAPVFDVMLENATHLCGAQFGTLTLCDGEEFRNVARYNIPSAFAESLNTKGFRPHPNSALGEVARTKRTAHIEDIHQLQSYRERDPVVVNFADLTGARTIATVPMLKNDELVGVISIFRQAVHPFSDKQITLLANFAAQAVIAIENTRLLNELRQRTDDLGESLEQQTATSEVLRVISSSPGELQPVFQAMLENAVRICEAKFGTLYLRAGDAFRAAALYNAPPAFVEFWQRGPHRPGPSTVLSRVLRTKEVVHISDITADQAYTERDPYFIAAAELGGFRTVLAVPMLKETDVLGAIYIYRQEIRPFSNKQIALLASFASQAVIAIENGRLLNELRESLEQQTATADVLEVISRSAFDLHPVFETVAESSVRLCGADRAFIFRFDGELLRMVAAYNATEEFTEFVRQNPIRPGWHSGSARAALERRTIHIPDVRDDPEYTYGAKDVEAIRTVLGVPILKGDELLGVMMIYHLEVKPFTDNQIALVETFADQAAIAIENVRLFDEIQDKSRQLEVASQHKSQFLANMSHELRTPLNAILGYTELMADGIYGELPEKTMGVLKRLESNGRHLLELINDVLDLSKIEAGQLVLELTDYSLEDIAQTVRSTLEPLAADKKLAFKVEVAPELPAGHGDGRRLTQVLINLVGNAIKFTDAGEVVITGGATDGSFHLSVRDTGPGISAVDQAKLFQEFQQADNAITRKKGAPAWGSQYPNASSRCTAAKSGSSPSSARARRFHSHCPSSSSSKSTWNQTSRHLSAQTVTFFPSNLLQCVRPLLMLWTAPPPARECQRCGCRLRLPRFGGATHANDHDHRSRHR